VEALRIGADIVITGRVTDTGLTLAPLIHAFNWPADAWDLMAAGTVAGHIIECGAQASGGNCLVDWQRIPTSPTSATPSVDAPADGSFEIVSARHRGSHRRGGGQESAASPPGSCRRSPAPRTR